MEPSLGKNVMQSLVQRFSALMVRENPSTAATQPATATPVQAAPPSAVNELRQTYLDKADKANLADVAAQESFDILTKAESTQPKPAPAARPRWERRRTDYAQSPRAPPTGNPP